jgi:Domain of unknown function (DUF4326)
MFKVLNARQVGRKPAPDRVYVGRPSKWGNPFAIGRDGTRDEVIAMGDAGGVHARGSRAASAAGGTGHRIDAVVRSRALQPASARSRRPRRGIARTLRNPYPFRRGEGR